MSTLKTNKILAPDGRTLLNNGGAVVQVVQSGTGTTSSKTGSSYSDTPLSVTITPSRSGNKILVMASFYAQSGTSWDRQEWILTRGNTELYVGDALGSAGRATGKFPYGGADSVVTSIFGCYLDSPSTTSATTYKIRWRDGNNDGTIYFNRSRQSDGANTACWSSMTAMEVVA